MDIQAIVNIISTVGFPIAVCVYLLYDSRETKNKLSDLIQNNTEAMTKLQETVNHLFEREE